MSVTNVKLEPIQVGSYTVATLFDEATSTLTYVIYDTATHDAVIIDPVLDYDPASGKVETQSVERLRDLIRQGQLHVRMVLETHAHADHLSSAQLLRREFDAPVAIGRRITEVQATFRPLLALPEALPVDGSQFDRLLADGEEVTAGSLTFRVLATPGHTPACSSYLFGQAVFTGDALFVDDYGTGRCDFPSGSAQALYRSVHDVLYALPDDTHVFVGHDYQPNGRPLAFTTTIGSAKRHNIHVRADTSAQDYVAFRTARDKTLAAPRLLFPSIQVNMDAGRLPTMLHQPIFLPAGMT